MKLLSEHAGLVEAPIDQVRDAVLVPETFDPSVTVEVDRAADRVQARGQWWWCGRFQLAEHPEGTLVKQQTYNLATGIGGMLVPFTVGRGHRQTGRQGLQQLLDDLTTRLGWRTSLL